MSESIYIKDWHDLKTKIPQESETHILQINEYSGWVKPKNPDPEIMMRYIDESKPVIPQLINKRVYLSTHSFYGSKHEFTTKLLQACGFNVVCANWDELEGY